MSVIYIADDKIDLTNQVRLATLKVTISRVKVSSNKDMSLFIKLHKEFEIAKKELMDLECAQGILELLEHMNTEMLNKYSI